MHEPDAAELRRQTEQQRLDSLKSQDERNQLGQFATPPPLAKSITDYIRRLWDQAPCPIRFLDPACGTGSFFSALSQSFNTDQIERAAGIEVDPAFARAATELWADCGFNIEQKDFTQIGPGDHPKYNLILTNPPYVRHHHMRADYKSDLKAKVLHQLGIKTSGLSGLYSFFLLLSDSWLEQDGMGVWLIPSEFMDVNYGDAIREYLTRHVQLLRIHRFDPGDVQFSDALVSSVVVVFRKQKPKVDRLVEMTFGGSLLEPLRTTHVPLEQLRACRKWTSFPSPYQASGAGSLVPRLGDLFSIKRGLATGANGFFILTVEDAQRRNIPREFRRPVLPGPRFIQSDTVERDSDGYPIVSPRLELIDCVLPESEIERTFPDFWAYLESGKKSNIHLTYLASKRTPWYSQEKREPAPFVFTYMGRTRGDRRTFRVIWNKSDATAHNVYLLLYPKPELVAPLQQHPVGYGVIHEELKHIDDTTLLGEGRVYGGGLHKLEPRELERVPVPRLMERLADLGFYRGQLLMDFSA